MTDRERWELVYDALSDLLPLVQADGDKPDDVRWHIILAARSCVHELGVMPTIGADLLDEVPS